MARNPEDPDTQDEIVLNEMEARQGREFHEMRYVLLIGLFGAFGAMIVAYLFFFA